MKEKKTWIINELGFVTSLNRRFFNITIKMQNITNLQC